MMALRLAAAAFSVLTGTFLCVRRKQPLFFKILVFGSCSYFLGILFESCWNLVYKEVPAGFHIGCLGYMGSWFFLLSAYFGAFNRLADAGGKEYRIYRLIAALPSLFVASIVGWTVKNSSIISNIQLILITIPLVLTLYFALKHLILPDVEMGIIRVMRPFNACVVLLGLCQTAALLPVIPESAAVAIQILICVFLIVQLPVAERGIQKWFM